MIKMRNVAIASFAFCATVQGYCSDASVCVSASGAAADRDTNPLSFPVYYQEVVADFTSSEDASRSMISIASLPNGAKCSFGTRWDDSSPAHLAKAAMLERAGAKGAFYLGGRQAARRDDSKNVHPFFKTGARELVSRGHAVGNHTWSHPYMTMLSPDEMFRQVMMTRIVLEDAIEHSVLSYASPFGWYGSKSWLSLELRTLAAKMIMETGHWVSGDNPFDGVPRNEWYPANRFSANDRNPDYEVFKKGLARQTELAAADEMSPRVTLGTHSWCDEAGNALQESWIKRHCIRPDWVQLNDYEYGAYRYSFLNGGVSRKSQSGKRAVFAVRRFDPAALGDEISLSLRFSSQPVSVKCGDRELTKDGNGCWTLPHDASRVCVSKVGVASDDGICAELPEIAMTVEPDRKSSCVVVKITNRSKNDFRDLYGVVHLPPEFAVRRRVFEVKSLAADSTIKRSVVFGETEAEVCPLDRQLFAASIDYTLLGTRNRLWAKAEVDAPQSIPVVRDTAMWTDAVCGKDLDDAELKALSAERGALRNLSSGIEWKRPKRTPADAWYNATVGGLAYYGPELKEFLASGKAAVAVVYQFEAKGDTISIFANRSSADGKAAGFFLNGEKVDVPASPSVLPAKKGLNRIVIKVPVGDGRLSRNIQLAVCNSCKLGDPCIGVPFVK